jgi:hypothetical protein
MARPGGNATGFTPIVGSLGGKWVAEKSATWNSSLLTIREARRYAEELMILNLASEKDL